MKKLLVIVGVGGMLALTSCTKEWTCKCVDNNDNTTYHDIPDATLKDADNTCESFQYNNEISYNNCSLMVD